jgi:hypothetical protein
VAGGIASAVATEVMTILAEIELDAIVEEVFVVLDSYQRAGLLRSARSRDGYTSPDEAVDES